MKKLLLGSTALVVGGLMAAPAMAADPIKMGVGGYYTFNAMMMNVARSKVDIDKVPPLQRFPD